MKASAFSLTMLRADMEKALQKPLSRQVLDTLNLAFRGHSGQFRAHRNEQNKLPFIVHAVGTAKLAFALYAKWSKPTMDLDTILCIALAHDLLEDTQIRGADIELVAGRDVRLSVEALTKPPAGEAGRSVAERNNRFLEQIKQGGKAVVFVKICDSIHNLSSPLTTPHKLYLKAIQKAKLQYLPLAEMEFIDEPLLQIYRSRIESAEKEAEKQESHLAKIDTPLTLDQILHSVTRSVEGKRLELHDIAQIIQDLCALDEVRIWAVKSVSNGIVVSIDDSADQSREIKLKLPQILGTAQMLENDDASLLSTGLTRDVWPYIIVVPLRLDAERLFLFAMGFASQEKHRWLTPQIANLLIEYLSHRLVISAAQRRADLAKEAAGIGLQIDINIADNIGIEPKDLFDLKEYLQRCSHARLIAVHRIEEILLGLDITEEERSLLTVESRLKSINSVINKMRRLKLNWCEFRHIDDIVGLRVICPSQLIVEKLERALMDDSEGLAANMKLLARHNFVEAPTVAGYRALHHIYKVFTHSKMEKDYVLCELQMRTMFQDVWAKISRLRIYKGDSNKNNVEVMRKMANSLEDCDRWNDTL